MLNLQSFTKDVVDAIKDTFPKAFEQAMLESFPEKTDMGNEIAKKFGESISDLIAEPFGERLAAAIDAYLKTAALKGTLITTGSPFTQTAIISPVNLGNPTAGTVPNTIGLV